MICIIIFLLEKERTSPIGCLDIAFQLINYLVFPAHGLLSFAFSSILPPFIFGVKRERSDSNCHRFAPLCSGKGFLPLRRFAAVLLRQKA